MHGVTFTRPAIILHAAQTITSHSLFMIAQMSVYATISVVTASQFLDNFPLANSIFCQQPLGMICSPGVNPIYNSSIEANACLSLDGNNGLQYINLAEVACAPRNVTNPEPPNSSSSASSTPSTLSATSPSPTSPTSSTSATISTGKGGSQTSTQSSADPTQSASGGGGGLDLSDRIALGVGIGVGVGLGLPAAIVAVWQLKDICMKRTRRRRLREVDMFSASG
jgi:hypothetical protein